LSPREISLRCFFYVGDRRAAMLSDGFKPPDFCLSTA
jgi:hypothetical protein